MSHFLFHALGRASGAARLLIGTALLAFLAACAPGGNAVTAGAVGDDSDGSVLIVSTLAGKPGESGVANGLGQEARFYSPTAVAVDSSGNIYTNELFSDAIRKISPSGEVTSFVPKSDNQSIVTSLAVDAFSNIYTADLIQLNIKKIDPSGSVSLYAGVSSDRGGYQDGTRLEAKFSSIFGVAVAKDSTVFVAETLFNGGTVPERAHIRSISAQGTVSTVLTIPNSYGFRAITLDAAGNRYAVLPDGTIQRLAAGSTELVTISAGKPGNFTNLAGIAVDKNTNTFILNQHSIQRTTVDGATTVFAGSVSDRGYRDGLLLEARFNIDDSFGGSVGGLAIAPDGTMYIADSGNHVIRKISKGFYVGGIVRGLTGSGTVNVQNNGGATQSLSNGSFTFSMPVAQSATYTAQVLSAEGHSCTVSNPTGQVTTTVSSIVVDCAPIVQPPQYSAGGVVSGLLSGQTVILKNGADKTVPLGNGNYTFLVKAASGTAYNVVVDTQPIGRTCSVSNGNSAINNANVTNVNVNCVTSTHSIAGNVIGLGSGTVGVAINSSPTQTISANGRFTLTSAINYGNALDVRITSQPVGQTCDLGSLGVSSSATQITGTVSGDLVMPLICRTNTYTVTAAVTGMSGAETVSLQMTGDPSGTQTLLLTGPASGAFTNRVPHGASVNLAVLSSPAGKTCSLTSPASITVTGASNVTVNCVVNAPIFYTVGGTVSGLPALTTINLMMASSDSASNQTATGLGNGAYQFLTTVPNGSTISIAPTSPVGYSCTVASPYATGALVSGNVTNANVSCVSTGGGGGGGGFTPGTVNGQVTNNGPDTRTILVENGVNQVAVVVNSNSTANFTIPGQLAQGVSYSVTASDGTMPTPGSGLLNCGVNNGTGNMVALPGAVSNVSVTCQLTLP